MAVLQPNKEKKNDQAEADFWRELQDNDVFLKQRVLYNENGTGRCVLFFEITHRTYIRIGNVVHTKLFV